MSETFTVNLSFKSDSTAGKILFEWWKGLEKNKGDRAALRRCGETLDVFFVPAFHQLRKRLLPNLSPKEKGKEIRIALIAALVASVKDFESNKRQSLPEQMGKAPKGSDISPVSHLRFRKMLECQNREDLFPLLRRMIRKLDKKVDIIIWPMTFIGGETAANESGRMIIMPMPLLLNNKLNSKGIPCKNL